MRWHSMLGAALGVVSWCGVATAADVPANPCDRLFVPDGYRLDCSVRGGASDWQVIVRPESGAFGALSELTLERVEEPIADRDRWLRDQLTVDVSSFNRAVEDFLASEDSPFGDTPMAAQLHSWHAFIGSLADWPLEGCTEPSDLTVTDGRQLACEWHLGPFNQYLTVRLVDQRDELYAIRIRAMNPKRLRHLVAIANSF